MRTPSCQIPEKVAEQPVAATIPEEKQADMIRYAQKLRQKWPHMKKERLMRKVAEHFKIKLV